MHRNKFVYYLILGSFLLGVFVISGCASVSISKYKPINSPNSKPQKIFVRDFDVPANVFYVDREGSELLDFRIETQDRLTRQLVRRLSENVLPAEKLGLREPIPRGKYWMLAGTFHRVNQGSRFLRMAIGFGAGATKMETKAMLYDLSTPNPRPLLALSTTGGSNAEPGAISAFNPITFTFVPAGAALSAAGGALGGVTLDSNRTAREISAAIAQYAKENNIPIKNPSLKPKMKGEFPKKIEIRLPFQ
ncbi:MAG: DUF4410 domain-containing protein [Chthoniobacterales bacterium]|nr:DUF4410 domain-containing protein [Chthoniobacterales bacterium]